MTSDGLLERAAALNNLGIALIKENKREQAIDHFESALKLAPKFPAAHYNLVLASHGPEQRANALRRFEDMLAETPDTQSEGTELYWRLHQLLNPPTSDGAALGEYYGQRGEDASLDEFFGFKANGYF